VDFAGELRHFRSEEAQAIALIQEAQALAEQAQLGQPLSYVYFDLALTALALGRYDEAFTACRKSVALAERVGDQGFWWCRGMNTLGRVYIELGDMERGAQHNREAVERALIFGDKETLRNAQLNLGDCALGRGDPKDALRIFEDLQAAFETDSSPGEWMKWRYTQHLWASLSETKLALDEPEAALAHADRCRALAEETWTKRYVSKGHRARARALARLGRSDEALQAAQTALEAAEEIGGPELVWRAHEAFAEIHAASGNAEPSRRSATGALAIIDRIAAGVAEPGAAGIFQASPDVQRLRVLAGE
jgi:tetratricopeptide (TPR) repeat protein